MRRLSLHNYSQVEAPARWPLFGLLAVAFAFPGCAGGGASSGTPPPPPPTVTVSVTPPTSNVLLGTALQLSVTVSGTENTAVLWSVNGVPGGNSSLGTVAPSGLYTAPGDLPSPASVQVAATSTASQSTSASAQVTIISDVSVGVSSPVANVELGAKQNFSATIASAGQPDSGVRWILSGAAGTENANYTAPGGAPIPNTVTITATPLADPSKKKHRRPSPFKLARESPFNRVPQL